MDVGCNEGWRDADFCESGVRTMLASVGIALMFAAWLALLVIALTMRSVPVPLALVAVL